jgi:hypothetical protein
MAGASTTRWQRFKFKYFKFLYKKCPEGNFHSKSDQLCWCRINECSGDWHGGVLVFETGEELIPYAHYYGDTLHWVWKSIEPFLRYSGKSIKEYNSTEEVIRDFMVFTSRTKTDPTSRLLDNLSENENTEVSRQNEIMDFQISEAKKYICTHESNDGSESSIEVCIIQNLLRIIKNKSL